MENLKVATNSNQQLPPSLIPRELSKEDLDLGAELTFGYLEGLASGNEVMPRNARELATSVAGVLKVPVVEAMKYTLHMQKIKSREELAGLGYIVRT